MKDRKDTQVLQKKIQKTFPEIWKEITGMLKGINEYQDKDRLGFATALGGLFSCILAETDESFGCSTAVLRHKSGSYMIHSDEYDEICPIVIANVEVELGNRKKSYFTSISHPFQLFGSAAGLNESFAFQGNSIFFSDEKEELKELYQDGKLIPKTFLSRKILESKSPEKAAKLYQKYPCSLPNHHIFISRAGIHSLEIRSNKPANISLKKILNP